MTTRIMVQLNIVRSITCCVFWIILLVSITEVYNQHRTVYGYEGATVILICPLSPPPVSGITTWRGPPSNIKYSINDDKNPSVDRGERLSVMLNTASGAYNLHITNLTIGVDDGMFICEVNTDPIQQYFVNLKFYVDIHYVTLIPSTNPLTIQEGTQLEVRCVVNSNAAPAPTITWYLESANITSIAVTNTTFITLTGNRMNNNKTLQCRAANNNKPPKIASTTLNVEYPPTINTLSLQNMIEGRDLLVTCQAVPGNPYASTFYWTKVDNPGFRQNGATLQLSDILRTSSGTYRCTAENNYINGKKGTDSESLVVNVQYPPTINALPQKNIIEGRTLSVTCQATPGNPNYTSFYWTMEDNPGFRQNETTLQLYKIQRTSSGTYKCTAENNYSNGEKGTHIQTMVVNVLYSPTIITMSRRHDIIEGRDLSVTCRATPGNPSSTTFYWTKTDNPGFRQNGPTLQLHNIQRTSSGTYRCTAENIYSNGEKGMHSQSMVVNVQYIPSIENRSLQTVNESESVTLTRNIVSNPLSNASWYIGTQLLKTESSVQTTTHTIENTKCTDTNNYTVMASNGVGNNVTTLVELIVNCKPMPDNTNITIGVTCTTEIEFSTTIIAYPEPLYELQYENGTRNTQMMSYITKNAVNNFTAHFSQTVIDQSTFGIYYLRMDNMIGESTVIVNVIEKKRKPDTPRNITVVCEITQTKVQWISSFNGGDPQYFTVNTLNGQDGTNFSYRLRDKGENKMHITFVSNLQPSVAYWFYVSAKNSYGSSVSEVTSCNTVQETTGSQTGVVAGSVVGTMMFITILLIFGIVFHRRYSCICNIAFEKRIQRDTADETNKDLSNYTTIKEQQEHKERNMYDDLTSYENANQYEDILKKENDGNTKNLYEKLQRSVDKTKEGNSASQSIPLKTKASKDDKFWTKNTEEYVNTSFRK